MIGVVLGLVAIVGVVVVIALASSGRSTRNGCINVTVPGATGATELYRCGAEARTVCASVGIPSGPNGALGQAIASACRKVGLPIPR
jgi:hypothetical protein